MSAIHCGKAFDSLELEEVLTDAHDVVIEDLSSSGETGRSQQDDPVIAQSDVESEPVPLGRSDRFSPNTRSMSASRAAAGDVGHAHDDWCRMW